MDRGTVARVFSCCRYLNGVLPSAYCRFYLVYEVIVNKSIKTDLMGLSAFVGAITALFASAGVTKCLSEKNENKNV